MINDKQLFLDGELMDMGDSVVAVTKQINDIGDLKSRQGDHTNKFDLPLTANNRKKLKFPEKVESGTTKPYSKMTFKYIEGGVELVPTGYAIVNATENDIEVTGYAGNSDFFELINGKKLRDLDLSDLVHIWDRATIAASRTNTSGYIYPIINYNGAIDTRANMDTTKMYPAYFIHTLFERIVTEVGWTLDGDILTDDRYLGMVLAFSQSVWEHSDTFAALQLFEAAKSVDTDYSIPLTYDSGATFRTHSAGTVVDDVPFENDVTSPGFDNNNNYDAVLYKAVIQEPGLYIFHAELMCEYNVPEPAGTGFSQGFTNVALTIYKNGVAMAGTGSAIAIGNGNGSQMINRTTNEATLDIGDEITVHVEMFAEFNFQTVIAGPYVTDPTTLDVRLKANEGGSPPVYGFFKNSFNKTMSPGSTVDSNLVLPDMTQVDFMKSIMNMLGISPDASSETQTLNLRAFKEINDNRPSAKNWSKKYVEQKPKIEYRIGKYYQTNDFLYKQDYGVPLLFGNASFPIADEVLPPRGTIIDLPYGSTIQVTAAGITISGVPITVPSINNFQSSKITQRILMLDPQSFSLTWSDNFVGESHSNSIPMAYFFDADKDFNIDWQSLLDEYYSVIIQTLEQTKKITVLLKLKLKDVNQFDHFVPVYIAQFSSYFYVNKISNFKRGSLTQVELIRL